MNKRLRTIGIIICILFALLAIWRAVDLDGFKGLYGVAEDQVDGWLHAKFDKQDVFTFSVDIIYTNEEPDPQNGPDAVSITEHFDISVDRSGKTISNRHQTFTVHSDGSQEASVPRYITVSTESWTADMDGMSTVTLSPDPASLKKLVETKINLWFESDRPIVYHTQGSVTSADRVFPGEDIGRILADITGDAFEPVMVVIKRDTDASGEKEGSIEFESDALFRAMYRLICPEGYSNDLLKSGTYTVRTEVTIYNY